MVFLLLLLGVSAASSAAILVRLCEAPPLVVASGRMAVASAVLLPLAFLKNRPDLRRIAQVHRVPVFVSGAFLGFHFAFWITSLYHTSVASAVFLVSTGPVFVALGSWLFLKEAIGLRTGAAILISLAGTAVLTLTDGPVPGHSLYGDLLAVGGAVTVSAHLLIGRRQRQHLPLVPYIAVANAVAAVLLLGMTVANGQALTGYSVQTYGWILLLGLGPQIIGHGSFNYAVKRIHPAVITVVLLIEPIAASALAWFILNEPPSSWVYVGGPIILAGVALAAWPRPGRPSGATGPGETPTPVGG